MDVEKIGVVGAGSMGSGIAQVCATAKYHVMLVDIDRSKIDQAMQGIESSLNRFAKKNLISEPIPAIVDRIKIGQKVSDCAGMDLVVEAVYEDISLKSQIFEQLSHCVSENTVLGTNTSAISVTGIASCASHPGRVVGIHFFNPVALLKVVEVIRGIETSDEAVKTARKFVESLGKKVIVVNRDVPGFLLNRINLPSNLEAMRAVEQGIGSIQDIDEGVKLAFGRPMGIFELGDLVGLDVTMAACDAIYAETKDPKYLPPVILRRMVKAGRLGKKVGKGWYEYGPDGTRKKVSPI